MPKIHLSSDKYKQLVQELEERKTKIRSEIGDRLSKAKDLGDLSENADYSVAKDDLADNERRIFELEDILASAEIVQDNVAGFCATEIKVGCRVRAQMEDGEMKEFKIVGQYDSDPKQNLISNGSPLGKAFLGHRVGDDVEFESPNGATKKYKVLGVE